MRWLRQSAFRLSSLFRKRKIEEDLSEEIRLHLEMQTAANLAAGMSSKEASYAALRDFGAVEDIKEQLRDQRGIPWIEQLAKDIRYAVRQLRRSPGFTGVAFLTLALGIGVNSTAFTVLNRLLLQKPPY